MNRKITATIIEDDKEALALLDIYLKPFDELEIVGKTTVGKEGLKQFQELLPDIVFLDIDMPGITGLEIARVIKSKSNITQVVFTTAFQQFAYDALSVEPLDYLVKPFGPDDLDTVIGKYKTRMKRTNREQKINSFVSNYASNGRVKFPVRTGAIIVNSEDIAILKAKANYCEMSLTNGTKEMVMMNLYKVVEILDSANFYRVSRSAYVNIHYLRRVDKKRRKCQLFFNNKAYEESITKPNLNYFEKLDYFPII